MAARLTPVKAFIEEFERLIIDDNIKQFILGDDDYEWNLNSTKSYLSYMNNCLTLAYLYVYGCYRQLTAFSESPDGDDFIPTKDNNSRRVLNSLKKTYVQYPLTPDLIQFVILDLQFDMLPGSPQNLQRVFGKFCDFSETTSSGDYFNLVKYFNHIAKWRLASTRYDELDTEQILELFQDMITNMEFLQGHLCKVGNDLAFVSRKFYEKLRRCGALLEDGTLDPDVVVEVDHRPFTDIVPCNHTIVPGSDYNKTGFYYLCNIERKYAAEALDLSYESTTGVDNLFLWVTSDPQSVSASQRAISVDYDADLYYQEITGMLWNESEDSDIKKRRS